MLAGGAGAPLAGQTADQRRALDAFRDSLLSVSDTIPLAGLERELLSRMQRNRRDTILHMRLGHVGLRQGELGGATHFDDAASEFKVATQLAPGFPYAWFGLGLAEFALGSRTGGRDSRPIHARDALSRASQAFSRAVSLEPALAPRLEEMARRAIRSQVPERAEAIRDALRRASRETRPPLLGRVVLALGRVLRDLGDSTAIEAFERYLGIGENRALGQVETGRMRLLLGDLSGQELYLDGAASNDPVVVAETRADLAPIASESQLADFDLRHGPARADMLRRFWSMRDRLELRADGERLAEHLRRLSVARREFLISGPDGDERLDDRGRIYVRHGEPDDRASFAIPGVSPNESWRYRRAGDDLVLHFAARQTTGDFRLIESVLDVSDVRAAMPGPRAAPGGPGVSGEQLLRSRAALASLYEQLPTGTADQVADYMVRERAIGRRGIQLATRSDSYAPKFPLELNAWGSVVVMGGSGSRPMMQVLFSIPGYAIEPATGAVGVVYPVRVRIVAVDTAGALVASVDTTSLLRPGDRVPANRSLVGHVGIPVLPGRLIVQAAIQYGDLGGTAFGVDTVLVPSPGAGVLALSDLLIGSRRGRLLLPLGDGSAIGLWPGGVVRQSDGLDLAIEVFGLASGEEATLKVFYAGEDPGTDLSDPARWRPFPTGWSESKVTRHAGAGAIARWRATLLLSKLKAGSYRLAVEVTDSAGRRVRREAPFTVEQP